MRPHQIITLDPDTTAFLADLLKRQHARLAQLDRPTKERSLTARNYDSAIRALGDYLARQDESLPTRSLLARWRDDLLAGRADETGRVYAVRSVNARLAAVRKLLRAAADELVDLDWKWLLADWARVEDARAVIVQDRTESDYGRRLTRDSLRDLVRSVPADTLKGLRDRALIAVMAGAGLRVSEAVALTMRDALLTTNATGQRGIRVRRGKHGRARIVVLSGWNSWVLRAVSAYTQALGLTPEQHPDALIFRGVRRRRGGYDSQGERLSARKAEDAVRAYRAVYAGERVSINPHDLRRTYAKLCKQSGMSWEALRANMGHSSVTITEKYVGLDIDWSDRVPNWSIEL